MLRPIKAYVEYVINYDYISKVLCINKDKPEMRCNGKCQLVKKLKQQEENDFKSLEILIEEYPIGFISILSLQIPQHSFSLYLKDHFNHIENYFYLRIQKVFHPPVT